MTTHPSPCATCAHIRDLPRGNRTTPVCGRSGENAFAERADPGGCGPGGIFWVAPGAVAPPNAALDQAMQALEQAQAAVRAAVKGA